MATKLDLKKLCFVLKKTVFNYKIIYLKQYFRLRGLTRGTCPGIKND